MKKILNQNKKPVREQLFVVNKSSGRLRLLLLILLFLIYWTILAQYKLSRLTISDNFNTLLPEPTNFTSGIVQEMLLGYFSLSTILFVVIPLLIFILTKKIIERYLQLIFSSIGLGQIERYLNNCAFSFRNKDQFFHKDTPSISNINQDYLSYLGGPVSFSFESSSMIIVQNIKNQDCYVIAPDSENPTVKFHLSHGDRIYAIILESDRQIILKKLKVQANNKPKIIFNSITFQFSFNLSRNNHRAAFTRKTKIQEANFLSYLSSDDKSIIHRFLYDETQSFLQNNMPILFDNISFPNSINESNENFSEKSPINHHENYAEISQSRIYKTYKAKRKHQHSRYFFLRKNTSLTLNTQDRENDFNDLVTRLSSYLNKQIKSFFHISTIQTSIIEIGELTING